METRTLRHNHFEEMSKSLGYPSPYEFAQHVRRMTAEERRKALDEFYGTTARGKKTQGKGKGKAKLCPDSAVKGRRRAVNVRPSRHQMKSKKPPLQFQDSLLDSPPQRKACNSTLPSNDGEPLSTVSPHLSPMALHDGKVLVKTQEKSLTLSPESFPSPSKEDVPSTVNPRLQAHQKKLQPTVSLSDTCDTASVVTQLVTGGRDPPLTIDALFGDVSGHTRDSSTLKTTTGGQSQRDVCALESGLAPNHRLPMKQLKPVLPVYNTVNIDEIFG